MSSKKRLLPLEGGSKKQKRSKSVKAPSDPAASNSNKQINAMLEAAINGRKPLPSLKPSRFKFESSAFEIKIASKWHRFEITRPGMKSWSVPSTNCSDDKPYQWFLSFLFGCFKKIAHKDTSRDRTFKTGEPLTLVPNWIVSLLGLKGLILYGPFAANDFRYATLNQASFLEGHDYAFDAAESLRATVDEAFEKVPGDIFVPWLPHIIGTCLPESNNETSQKVFLTCLANVNDVEMSFVTINQIRDFVKARSCLIYPSITLPVDKGHISFPLSPRLQSDCLNAWNTQIPEIINEDIKPPAPAFQFKWSDNLHKPIFRRAICLLAFLGFQSPGEINDAEVMSVSHIYGARQATKGYIQIVIPMSPKTISREDADEKRLNAQILFGNAASWKPVSWSPKKAFIMIEDGIDSNVQIEYLSIRIPR